MANKIQQKAHARVRAQQERLRREREQLQAAMSNASVDDPRLMPAVDLIARTGASDFQIRFCAEDTPTIWMAAALWGNHWESAAAMNPLDAVFRLCDAVIDGGVCLSCGRPAGFEPSMDEMPLAPLVCWYQWDPELKTFRRGCAGDESQ